MFLEDTDSDLLTEFQRFGCVRTPMNTGRVATKRNIRSDLVKFAPNRELISISTQVRHQTESIISRFEWR